jgi:hypothetical protein
LLTGYEQWENGDLKDYGGAGFICGLVVFCGRELIKAAPEKEVSSLL